MNTKKVILYFFSAVFILRLWGIHFGLPYDGLHPTENFSISQSLQYIKTGNFKPLNFQHPTLFQYLISLISYLIFLPPEKYVYFYLLGRLISCLASFASVYFLYILAKELFNSQILGLLCAAFLGFNLLSIKYAHYAVPDSLSLLFMVLAVMFSLKIMHKPNLKNYLICALFCGLSIASKFSSLVSLGFLVCAHFLSGENKKQASLHKLILSLLAVFLVFALTSPYHLFYLTEVKRDFLGYLAEKGYFVGLNLKSQGFFMYPFILLPDVFGLLRWILVLLGLWTLFFKDRKTALLLFLPLIFYLLIIGKEQGGSLQNILPMVPVLSIFATNFFVRLKEKNINKVIVILLVIISLLPQLTKAVIFDYFLSRKDTRILAEEWLIQNAKSKAKIGFERYTALDLNYLRKSPTGEMFNATYFVPSLSVYSASFYKEAAYDYIITSSFRQDSYSFFCRTQKTCQGIQNYATYETEFKKVAVFTTPSIFRCTGFALPWGTWPHYPTVTIYKITDN